MLDSSVVRPRELNIVPGIRRQACLLFLALGLGLPVVAGEPTLRVAVLNKSPPMSYVDAAGKLAGFNLRIDTAERRSRVLFAKLYYRSSSIWLARPGVEPGVAGIRVATVAGSAQSRYARAQGWNAVNVPHHSQFPALLTERKADAVLLPMASALTLRREPSIQSLGLMTTVIQRPELSGEVCFAIDPQNPELRGQINKAFDRIKRDGRFDRQNREFLPFRLQ